MRLVSTNHGVCRASRRLVIFAKLPRAGDVKTRLIPVLGERGAAELYRAFLDDTIENVRHIEDVTRSLWIVRHPDAIGVFQRRYEDFAVREQPCGDLGDRMRLAFDRSFAERADYVVIVGSDLPTLPASYIERAFVALNGTHLVLGPTEDGGYYAIGLRRHAWPKAAGLFDRIPWSTQEVLSRTRRRAEDLGLCRVELPMWYDVDEPRQLARLASDADPGSATMRVLRSVWTPARGSSAARPGARGQGHSEGRGGRSGPGGGEDS